MHIKNVFSVLLLVLVGCAHGKMGRIEMPLDPEALPKRTLIRVRPVDPNGMVVTGDHADDQAKIAAEKDTIRAEFHRKIVDALKARGFLAEAAPADAKQPGTYLSGKVTRFEHGSGAARFWVGMGSGSSNLFTDFTLEDAAAAKVLSKFEVIGTSGGRGGWTALSSFLEAHLDDGALKVSQYLNRE